MFARLNVISEKTRFYGALQISMVAWIVLCLAASMVMRVPGIAFYVVSMGGLLFILGWAMRANTYLHIRGYSRQD